jgi:predicted PurR-regulated permease PerM
MTTTDDNRSPTPHRDFAGRVALATLVVLGILALVAIVWVGRVIVALLFFAIVIAAAIRPSVETMKRRRVPRGIRVLLHYALFFGLIALGLWSLIPAAIDQVQAALGPSNGLREEAQQATGIKQDVLVALDRRLHDLPSGGELLDPAVEYGRTAFEVIIGTFFVFATAAY